MNLENLKNEYYEQNDLVEKDYVEDKKNKQLNKQFDQDGDLLDNTFKGYYYESGENGYDFYQKKYPNYNNTELEQLINIQNSMYIKKASKDIHSMKNILLFWFILTIINLIVSFIVIAKAIS